MGTTEMPEQGRGERVEDQRAFAGSADPGDAGQTSERKIGVDLPEIVGGGTAEPKPTDGLELPLRKGKFPSTG